MSKKYHVCQDGNMFYIQTDPEDETYLASFRSEIEAEKYAEYLEVEE